MPRYDDTEPCRRRRRFSQDLAMIPFLVQRDWYQRYWLDEGPGCVQAPLLRARIGIAAKSASCACFVQCEMAGAQALTPQTTESSTRRNQRHGRAFNL
jgi:hypothetical protein